jgi:dCTP diphosphatase
MDLELLQKTLREFRDERDWARFHLPKNLVMALGVEAAELMEIFQWLTPEQIAQVKPGDEIFLAASDEVADVFVYLLRLCDELQIDLEQAVKIKLKKNAEKYPIDQAFGNAKKYTEWLSKKNE